MVLIKNHNPDRLTSSKLIYQPAVILFYIYYDNIYNPSLTSFTLDLANLMRTGIKFNNDKSYVSPVHVEIAIPLRGCNLKLEAILSIIILFERSLFINEISLILTQSYILVCSLYNLCDNNPFLSMLSKIESAYSLTAAVKITSSQ